MNELNKDDKLQTSRHKDENVYLFTVKGKLFGRVRTRERERDKDKERQKV